MPTALVVRGPTDSTRQPGKEDDKLLLIPLLPSRGDFRTLLVGQEPALEGANRIPFGLRRRITERLAQYGMPDASEILR
jgi:hypothetical protein